MIGHLSSEGSVVGRAKDPSIHAGFDVAIHKGKREEHGCEQECFDQYPDDAGKGSSALDPCKGRNTCQQKKNDRCQRRRQNSNAIADEQIGKAKSGKEEKRPENDKKSDLFGDHAKCRIVWKRLPKNNEQRSTQNASQNGNGWKPHRARDKAITKERHSKCKQNGSVVCRDLL